MAEHRRTWKGGNRNARRPDREYLPFTDEVTEAHRAGEIHAGLYPLLRGDTCRLLACDFDSQRWVLDALAYLDAARAAGIPASGNVNPIWPHCDGLKWPHPMARCGSSRHRANAVGGGLIG